MDLMGRNTAHDIAHKSLGLDAFSPLNLSRGDCSDGQRWAGGQTLWLLYVDVVMRPFCAGVKIIVCSQYVCSSPPHHAQTSALTDMWLLGPRCIVLIMPDSGNVQQSLSLTDVLLLSSHAHTVPPQLHVFTCITSCFPPAAASLQEHCTVRVTCWSMRVHACVADRFG